MSSFDVLTEPWIPVVDREGRSSELGLLAVLERAHELAEVRDPSPAIQFGIYRLLTAFATDAFELHTTAQLADLLQQGRFDPRVLAEYAEACGPVFDLFDPQRPWLQTATAEDKLKPVAELMQHLPSGSFASHFHHAHESDFAFGPAACARALTAISPFMTSGGAGLSPSINGIPPWYVLVHGQNLFETVILNSPVVVPESMVAEDDVPAWRDPVPVTPKQEVSRFGLLQGLTWRPRTVRLAPGTGGTCSYTGRQAEVLVREMVFTFGLKAAGAPGLWQDPNVAYRWTDGEPSPMRPREGRMLWQDFGPFVLDRRGTESANDQQIVFSRPMVIEQAAAILPSQAQFTLEAYGLRTDGKMKIFEWQVERLPVQAALLHRPEAPGMVREALSLADEVLRKILPRCLKLAYPREAGGNKLAFQSLIEEARQRLTARLQRSFSARVLQPLARPGCELDQFKECWFETVFSSACDALNQALDGAAADADGMVRQVRARDHFFRQRTFLRRQHLPTATAVNDSSVSHS